jgi:hypothetical protein
MSPFRTVLLLAAATVLPACFSGSESFCTFEARASVQVMVVDTQGNFQRNARVTFTRDAEDEQEATCLGTSQTPTGCGMWVADYERPGEFLITATSADGTRTVQQQVLVTEDECHVITELVKLTLPD